MPRHHLSLNKGFAGFCLALLSLLLTQSVAHPALGWSPGIQAEGAWFYFREQMPISRDESLVEMIAVGDVMPGRGLADQPTLFQYVAPELQRADLVVGNLEGAMAPNNSTGDKPGFSLLIPPSAAVSLQQAGFDLLGLANNHTLDAGMEGLHLSQSTLLENGITPLLPAQPTYQKIKQITFAFIAWTEITPADRSELFNSITIASSQADQIILLLHWGTEYNRTPNLQQRDLAEELLQAGVDVILGCHPHVVQDIQLLPPLAHSAAPGESHLTTPLRLVAFSLGNFAFDQGWDDTGEGLALRLIFDSEGLYAAQALPLHTAPRPTWMAPDEAAGLLARILPVQRIGFCCSSATCQQVEVPQEREHSLFWSGAIDLTGDGNPEIIRREGEQIVIYQDGEVAWRSPPQWQVTDLALGDPNHDGRYEILTAFRQTTDPARNTSHPFVIGYRGGKYRVLWGGSPVEYPLLEVELADLDGDGTQELAVIETSPDEQQRYLSLWRWHGWGFSLVWRSLAGNYHDLVVLPAQENLLPRLSVSTQPYQYIK